MFQVHIISTHSLFLGNLYEITINIFDPVHRPMSLIDLLIRRYHISSLWIMPDLYEYWRLFTSFEYGPGNKDTLMFYVANAIIFRIFLELLCKSTLIVCFKLNIIQPPRVNQFDICALLVRRLYQVYTVILNDIIWLLKTWPLAVH